MEYPKPVMNMSALVRLGISETFLKDAYTDKHQTFAWRTRPTLENSPILFDTKGLEEYRLKQVAAEKSARAYRNVI